MPTKINYEKLINNNNFVSIEHLREMLANKIEFSIIRGSMF